MSSVVMSHRVTWLILRLDLVNVSGTTLPSPGCSDYRVTGFVDGTPLTYTFDHGASRDAKSLFDCDASVDCGRHLIPHHLVSTLLACDVEARLTDLALGVDPRALKSAHRGPNWADWPTRFQSHAPTAPSRSTSLPLFPQAIKPAKCLALRAPRPT